MLCRPVGLPVWLSAGAVGQSVGQSICWSIGLSASRYVGLSVCRSGVAGLFWSIGVSVCRSVAPSVCLPGCRSGLSVSLLVCRSVDLLVWSVGRSVCRLVGLSVGRFVSLLLSFFRFRSVGRSVCWSVSLLICWSVGLSVSRSVGRSVCRSVGRSRACFFEFLEAQGLHFVTLGVPFGSFFDLGSTLGSPGLTVERFGGLLSVLGGLFGVRGCRLGANRDHFGFILGGFGIILGGFGMDFGRQNRSRFHLFFRMFFSSIFEGSRLHF